VSSQPALTATLSHREGLWVRNPNLSSGSANDRWVQRVQSVEPVGTHNNTDYYQIGSVDKAGTTQDPTTYRIQFQENLHHAGTGMYLAGVDPSTGSGYNVGNLVSQTNSVYVPRRNDSDSVFEELAFGTARVTEVTYTFVNNGSCTADFTLMGTSGSYYHTAGTFPHPLWGVFDTATPGAVHGRELSGLHGGPDRYSGSDLSTPRTVDDAGGAGGDQPRAQGEHGGRAPPIASLRAVRFRPNRRGGRRAVRPLPERVPAGGADLNADGTTLRRQDGDRHRRRERHRDEHCARTGGIRRDGRAV